MKRKTNQKYPGRSLTGWLAGGALLFLLTACGGDTSLPYEDGAPDVPASGELVPVVMEAMVENGSVTRATTTTLNSGSIGVFRTAPVSTWCPAQYNVPYTNSGSGWQATDTDNKVLVGGEDASLHAYYPYNSVTFDTTVKTQTTLTVKDYTVNNDLCYAAAPTAVINNKNPKASFVLKHAYARFKLSITRNDNYPNDCKITKLVMQPVSAGSNFYTTRTMDISKSSGDVTQLGGNIAANWTPDLSALVMYTTGIAKSVENTEIDKLFPPQEFSAGVGLKLTLTIDALEYKVTIPDDILSALKAGYESIVKLEVQSKAIEVLGVNIRQWTDDSIGKGDSFLD